MKDIIKITPESLVSNGQNGIIMKVIVQNDVVTTPSFENDRGRYLFYSNNDNAEHVNSPGGSRNLNQVDIFPAGIYRKINDVTLTSLSRNQGHNIPLRNADDVGKRKWVVLIAAFLTTILTTGFPFNMTVLNLYFLEEFAKSNAETSLVQSAVTGIFYIAGLPVGAVISKYGVQKVGICGGLLAGLGLVLSFLATSISYLVVTVGCLTGIGVSACFVAASTAVGEYFSGNSKLEAMVLLSFGTGCGAVVYPNLLDVMTKEYGWRGCMLINGGLMMNLIICFAVCKPRIIGVQKLNKDNNNCDISKIPSEGKQVHKQEDGIKEKVISLVKNKVYIVFVLGVVFSSPAITSVSVFLVNFLQFKGFDNETSVFLYVVLCIFSTVSRLVARVLKRITHFSVLMVPAFFISIGAVTCFFLPNASTYEHHILLMAFLGMAIGGTFTFLAFATAKLVGTENYSVGVGVLLTLVGIGDVCGGPISGYLIDKTGSFTLSYYAVSIAFAVSTCLFTLSAIMRRRNKGSSSLSKYIESRGKRRRPSIIPWKAKVEYIF